MKKRQNNQWNYAFDLRDPYYWHVYPVGDIAQHFLFSAICPCNPRYLIREDGAEIISHNSFDGRELREEGHFKFGKPN